MAIYSYNALKTSHRAERDGYPQPFSLRIHRSLSWLDSAEQTEHLDGKFIFLWISFNAAYSAELHRNQNEYESQRFSRFLHQVVNRDKQSLLATILWQRYPNAVRLLLDNQYVFQPFWDFHNGVASATPWEELFLEQKKSANAALAKQDTYKVLRLLFQRLYVLRNQLIHGGATWKGQVNRAQIKDGTSLLGDIVPLFIEIMMDNAHMDWGKPVYPVISDEPKNQTSTS